MHKLTASEIQSRAEPTPVLNWHLGKNTCFLQILWRSNEGIRSGQRATNYSTIVSLLFLPRDCPHLSRVVEPENSPGWAAPHTVLVYTDGTAPKPSLGKSCPFGTPKATPALTLIIHPILLKLSSLPGHLMLLSSRCYFTHDHVLIQSIRSHPRRQPGQGWVDVPVHKGERSQNMRNYVSLFFRKDLLL